MPSHWLSLKQHVGGSGAMRSFHMPISRHEIVNAAPQHGAQIIMQVGENNGARHYDSK